MEPKKTITRKKVKPKEEAIISDLEIAPVVTEEADGQLKMDDTEGLVSKPQLKGEKKTVQPTYTQPGTNNQSRTVIKE